MGKAKEIKLLSVLEAQRIKQKANTRWFIIWGVTILLLVIGQGVRIVRAQEPMLTKEKPTTTQNASASEKEEVENKPRQKPKSDKVWKYIKEYPGSTISREYYGLLKANCTKKESLETVIAIAVAECGLNPARCGKENNMWGWYKNGDWGYDPSPKVMAKEICRGVSTYYLGVGDSPALAEAYTGGDRTAAWMKNYRGTFWALKAK